MDQEKRISQWIFTLPCVCGHIWMSRGKQWVLGRRGNVPTVTMDFTPQATQYRCLGNQNWAARPKNHQLGSVSPGWWKMWASLHSPQVSKPLWHMWQAKGQGRQGWFSLCLVEVSNLTFDFLSWKRAVCCISIQWAFLEGQDRPIHLLSNLDLIMLASTFSQKVYEHNSMKDLQK